MNSQTNNNYLTVYDLMGGMRGLAAIAVLSSHERNILFLDGKPELSFGWKAFYFFTGFGHQAVMIFFVLSGYWITKSVVRHSSNEIFPWPEYLIDRLSRLWIVLIPALLLGAIFDSIGRDLIEAPIYLGRQGTNALTWDVGTRLSFINLVGNVAFLQNILVLPFGSNAALWSLSNELWYYVWFPPLYQIFQRRRPSIAAGLFVVITMIAFRRLIPGYVCWLFGSIVFVATQKPAAHALWRYEIGGIVAALLFLLDLYISRTSKGILSLAFDGPLGDVLVSGSFAFLLFMFVRSRRTYPCCLGTICRYGTESSYSLYVVHFPLVVFLAALFLTPSRRLPPSAGLLLIFGIVGAVVIMAGWALSAVTEAHTGRVRQWLKRKRRWSVDRVA